MNKILAFLFVLVLLGSCGKPPDPAAPIENFQQLKAFFANPPASYRTQPFWVWNDSITRERIDSQLVDLKEMGFGGVFIHPRYGLITEYLGEEWHELYKYAVDKAGELGMEVWIYDENSFPSGFGGGIVPATMPESYNQGSSIVMLRQNRFVPDSSKFYFRIFLKKGGNYLDITSDFTRYIGKTGDFVLLEKGYFPRSKWYAGYSYVDILKPGVTDKFIELTMSGYEKKLGAALGTTVKGIFTDEPNTNPMAGNAIRWTPDMFEQFEKKWAYRLDDNLLSLFEETGNWRKVRHDYNSLLLQLFIERWSIPWNKYTEEKSLKWTGHYWEHGWPGLADGPDNMAMYEYHQMPGIDMLFSTMDQSEFPEQFGNIRAVKELASVANQTGRRRTLSETYGASGWELSFADMKRLGEWEYVLGVNFMNQHLSYMSIKGDRKHDFPQSFSYHEPWWQQYKAQAEYFGRLSLALASGRQTNRILVLEPTTTAWMYDSPVASNAMVHKLKTSFHGFLQEMELAQVEYDIGCENIIRNLGRVDSGKFIVGERTYDLLVLPPNTENIESSSMKLIREFLETGGRLVSVQSAPQLCDGLPDTALAALPLRFARQWITAPTFPEEGIMQLMQSPGLRFEDPLKTGGVLLHMRRILADGQLLFLVNSSISSASAGVFHAAGKEVFQLDLEKGIVKPYPSKQNKDELEASFNLPPGNSVLLFISKEGKAGKLIPREYTYAPAQSELHSQIEPLDVNVLALDYCTLRMPGLPDTLTYYYTASFMIWSRYGEGENPWVSSSQYKTELVDKDTFSTGTGFSLSYSFILGKGVDMQNMLAVAENPSVFKCSVNGKQLQPIARRWWLDKGFPVYRLDGLLQTGENTLTLNVSPMSIFAEPHPVYILGNFGVQQENQGFSIQPRPALALGSWKHQGFPFYANRMQYTRRYRLDHMPAKALVKLHNWSGVLSTVQVNGRNAGQIIGKPDELDVTGFLRKGDNEVVVVVYGSLKNLLGPFHLVRQRGIVTPWSFKFAEPVQASGNEYDQLDYGLLDDMELMIAN